MKKQQTTIPKETITNLLKKADDLLMKTGSAIGATIEAIDDCKNVESQDFALRTITRTYSDILHFVEQMRTDLAIVEKVEDIAPTDDTISE